jgi:hypothetical protein
MMNCRCHFSQSVYRVLSRNAYLSLNTYRFDPDSHLWMYTYKYSSVFGLALQRALILRCSLPKCLHSPVATMSDNKEVGIESNSLSASNGDHFNPQLGASEIFIDPVVLKRITSKFDKFMMPQMAVLMIIAYLDRSNIGLFQLPSWISAFQITD